MINLQAIFLAVMFVILNNSWSPDIANTKTIITGLHSESWCHHRQCFSPERCRQRPSAPPSIWVWICSIDVVTDGHLSKLRLLLMLKMIQSISNGPPCDVTLWKFPLVCQCCQQSVLWLETGCENVQDSDYWLIISAEPDEGQPPTRCPWIQQGIAGWYWHCLLDHEWWLWR